MDCGLIPGMQKLVDDAGRDRGRHLAQQASGLTAAVAELDGGNGSRAHALALRRHDDALGHSAAALEASLQQVHDALACDFNGRHNSNSNDHHNSNTDNHGMNNSSSAPSLPPGNVSHEGGVGGQSAPSSLSLASSSVPPPQAQEKVDKEQCEGTYHAGGSMEGGAVKDSQISASSSVFDGQTKGSLDATTTMTTTTNTTTTIAAAASNKSLSMAAKLAADNGEAAAVGGLRDLRSGLSASWCSTAQALGAQQEQLGVSQSSKGSLQLTFFFTTYCGLLFRLSPIAVLP